MRSRRIRRLLPVAALMMAVSLPAQETRAAAAGTLTVRFLDRSVVLTAGELAALPRQTVRVQDDADSATLSGVRLWDVLQKAGAVSNEASGRQRAVMYLRVTGADGQSAVIALVEVDPGFSRRTALLADRRGGRPLDPVEGPWRVILPDDQRHARWIRGLVTISVETLPAR
jgi:hypothetical protein